ncbi:putative 26S proteasome regulatory subunit [Coemansia aciculifera]|uniref:Probable 26S proteasome regulatory subunit p27 n=2 Tax=Coemansia TaxID=4863 RepID=A0A9W8H2J2_9FUNG|nr:putative 26S proteasome regulatory subunit [Coemansia pectinata]KAJ2868194.1 putative 26S proteasome regulatory subunit [Coemansia aciculifera]KAJ2877099.1 putative 26S proteasome regulatory subunit [Coemansia aciculifera]KAJ2887109.1 putative 26S proteasome regulatory subunit [Coemansia aciculifera]
MERAQSLMKDKVALENEIRTLELDLKGMSATRETSLIDSEGFPRADIDVAAIREIRRSLICKQNDLKALMAEIEQSLISLHQGSQDSSAPKPKPVTMRRPFARISIVEHSSPASEAGLLAGDKIVAYGLVNASNHNKLRLLIEETSNNIDKPIDIEVERVVDGQPQLVELKLRPRRKWGGDGLLGCFILPL